MSNEQKITIERERRDAEFGLRQDIERLNNAVSSLWEVEELRPLPLGLGDITQEWLAKTISDRVYPIRADRSLTAEERQSRMKPWAAIKQAATRYVHTIQEVLQSWPGVQFSVDGHFDGWGLQEQAPTYSLPPEQIAAIAESAATYPLPAEAREHYTLIQAVKTAAEQLRVWEKRHDARYYPLGVMGNWSLEDLAERWISRAIINDHRYQHLGIRPIEGTSIY